MSLSRNQHDPDPWEHFDPNGSEVYAFGYKLDKNGNKAYFSGHVDPDIDGPPPPCEEAEGVGRSRGQREGFNFGRMHR